MKQFTELGMETYQQLIREAIAAIENTEPDDVFIMKHHYSISASEGLMPDVNVVVAIPRCGVLEAQYTMRWSIEKERFVSVHCIRRKIDKYTVVDERKVFNPLYQKVTDEYIDFAIAHVLRELGFRKRTCLYFVKAKGEKPKLFRTRYGGGYSYSDFNGYSRFFPNLGELRKVKGVGVIGTRFQPYDKAGYLCAAPSGGQIIDFCKYVLGIEAPYLIDTSVLFGYNFDKQKLLKKLIKEYRKRSGFTDAFRRYAHDI